MNVYGMIVLLVAVAAAAALLFQALRIAERMVNRVLFREGHESTEKIVEIIKSFHDQAKTTEKHPVGWDGRTDSRRPEGRSSERDQERPRGRSKVPNTRASKTTMLRSTKVLRRPRT